MNSDNDFQLAIRTPPTSAGVTEIGIRAEKRAKHRQARLASLTKNNY